MISQIIKSQKSRVKFDVKPISLNTIRLSKGRRGQDPSPSPQPPDCPLPFRCPHPVHPGLARVPEGLHSQQPAVAWECLKLFNSCSLNLNFVQ